MTNTRSRLRAIAAVFMSMILALTMVLIPNEVSALGLSKKSFTLTKGYATTLKVTGTNSTAKWASSDTSVATVSSSGKVIGKGPGTATITATVDGTTLKATVKIVGGKLSVSSSNVTIAENSTEYITVRAKGSHALKANSDDKSIVTTGWVKPWKNNDIRLKLTARGTGTTTVRIYMTQFPDVYTTVKVTVGSGSSSSSKLNVSTDKVTVKAGDTAAINLYSTTGKLDYALSNNSIAAVSEGTWSGTSCKLTIKGLSVGTTNLVIADKADRSVKKTVTITVTNGTADGYYVVSESIPNKKTSTDQIYRYQVNNKYKYILVPAKYDEARINGAEAKDRNSYEYYKIYNVMPSKKASTDGIKEFSVIVGSDGKITAANASTVSTTPVVSGTPSGSFIDPNYVYYNNIQQQPTVTNNSGAPEKRYVLVPNGYDEPQFNTLVAGYTKSFDYWTVYNQTPSKKLASDIVDSWTATVNYKQVTRYILLPQLYDQAKLQNIKDKDMGASLGGYYAVTAYMPTKRASTDQIITFTTGNTNTNVINNPAPVYDSNIPVIDFNSGNVSYNNNNNYNYNYNGGQTLYILVPQNYDEARVNDAKAKYIGYEYNKIYATYPNKQVSSDVVEQWSKIVDGKSVTRYALYPAGYSASYLTELKNKDMQTSSSAYYIVSNSQPVPIASNDIPKSWWNPQTNQMRYMIVPYNYDVTRYNDAVAADTGDFQYYHTYSKSPTYKQPNDSVQSAVINGKTVYMLIPANYDQAKINMGFSGQEVTA